MSQPEPHNSQSKLPQPPAVQPPWPQAGQNPFADQGQSPFAPSSIPAGYYPPPTRLEDEPLVRWVVPIGTSGWAIAAGYFGLFSVLCLPAPVALILGIVAVRDLRRNPRLSGWGRAIFAVVMGSLFTLGAIASLIAGAIGSMGS